MFKSLYTKVFIGIVVFDMKSKIYVELLDRHNNITNVIVKDFNSLVVDDEMYVFISKFINKTPFYYISVLDNSTPQGMIATCLEDELSNKIDLDIFHHTCHKDKWAFYVAKQDIDILKNNYIKIGLDFIFSPFAVMVEFFKDKLDDEMVLFILMQDDSYAMSIFDEGKLLYSDHHVFNDDNDSYKLLSIKESIEHFYKDLIYDSGFINSLYIADTTDNDEELKRYFMDEMFLDANIYNIELHVEICRLAKAELNGV